MAVSTRSTKRKSDDEENCAEGSSGGKKQHVEEVESAVSLSDYKQQNYFEFVAELKADVLWNVMEFLKPHDILACLSTCTEWREKVDDQVFWKEIAKRDFHPFVSQMKSIAETRGIEVNYKSITKGLTSVKPLCRKVGNDTERTTLDDLRNIFVIVHIRDKESGDLVHWYFKNLQELIRVSSRRFKLSVMDHGSEPLLFPTRLSGESSDYFQQRFEECWRVPQRVADNIGVSLRLWRTDTQQAICLYSDSPPAEMAGFTTMHGPTPFLPAAGSNTAQGLLLCWVNSSLVATLPPSYDNGGANSKVNDWRKIRYSIASLEFGITAMHGGSTLESANDIFQWWNALDWK
ncbi:MAG: hypothetical protein SGBAC_013144 [Bacillariaceae sp.]